MGRFYWVKDLGRYHMKHAIFSFNAQALQAFAPILLAPNRVL